MTATTVFPTEAQRFWIELSNFDYVPLFFINQYSYLSNQYSDLFSLDQFVADMETYVQNNLNYAATLDDILTSFEDTINTQLGFWKGVYFLFDQSNQLDQFHVLTIDDNSITWDGQAITTYTFNAATLMFTGTLPIVGETTTQSISASLQFAIPAQPSLNNFTEDNVIDPTVPDPVKWLDQRVSFQRRCSGTVTIDGTTSQVYGKQGCYTPQGAGDEASIDPIDYWNGIYNASIATGTTVNYPAEGLTVDYANSVLNLSTLGDIQGFKYFNNSLSWTTDSSIGQLVFYRTFNGLRAIAGTISIQGQTSYIQAFYRESIAPATPVNPAAVSKSLSTTVEATAVIITTTSISAGVSNRNYPAQTLTATGGTSPYNWSSSNLPPGLTLSADGQLSGIPIQLAGNSYDFNVTATDSTGQSGTKVLTLKLVAPLSIKTTSLPDAVSDQNYSVILSAQGGDSTNYQWQVTTDTTNTNTIGYGLTLDKTTGKISGKPSIPAGQDNVASFAVKVTSTVAGISLESESTFTIKMIAVFSSTLIMSIVTGALGLLFGTGLLWNIKDRYSKWQDAKKKAEQDPSKEVTFENLVKLLGENLKQTQDVATVKSTTAKNNANGVTDGTLVNRLKQDFKATMMSELKALNTQRIELLKTARDVRDRELNSLDAQLAALEDQIKEETVKKKRDELEEEYSELKEEFLDKAKDYESLEKEVDFFERENKKIDRNISDVNKIILEI